MKAMLLAAGLGTRLQPLTLTKPKALIEIGGISLLERAILNLANYGVDAIIINIHHFGKQVIEFIENKKFPGVQIAISDERNQLLDTGGGLLNASWFFTGNEPFILHNVDIITSINLDKLIDFHVKHSPIATLAVQQRISSRYFHSNANGELCGWENVRNHHIKTITSKSPVIKKLAFSGIHVLSPAIFPLISETGTFSIIDTYLRLAEDYSIRLYDHTGDDFFDVGKFEQLKEIESKINEKSKGL